MARWLSRGQRPGREAGRVCQQPRVYQIITQVYLFTLDNSQTPSSLENGGGHAIVALAWSVGIALVSYLWAVRLYNCRRAAGATRLTRAIGKA